MHRHYLTLQHSPNSRPCLAVAPLGIVLATLNGSLEVTTIAVVFYSAQQDCVVTSKSEEEGDSKMPPLLENSTKQRLYKFTHIPKPLR
jgi:hypothetical protein